MGLEPTCNQLPFLQGISLRGYSPLSRDDRIRTCDPLVPNQMRYHLRYIPNFAVRTGLEPATPGVTGLYSDQLNYRTKLPHPEIPDE